MVGIGGAQVVIVVQQYSRLARREEHNGGGSRGTGHQLCMFPGRLARDGGGTALHCTALHSRAQVEDVYERTKAAARGGPVWGGRAGGA